MSGESMPREIVELAVASAFQVPLHELRAPTRCRATVAFARQVAMYLMHVGCGLSLTQVGALVGRDRTTVAHACGIVEDRRDDPAFDGTVERLETAVMELTQAAIMLRPGASPDCGRPS
ncbi:MAG: hypothetical protein Kow0032_01130 [Methyloligellaceae bacterium]